MDSDIELWNSRRKKVVVEEDLDPADFEHLLLENRDAYSSTNSVLDILDEKDQLSDAMDLSVKEGENLKQKLLKSPKGGIEDQHKDLIAHSLSSESLDERLAIGILWDGSDSASAEQLFHALPRSNRIVYLIEQAVSNRYLALEVEEIRRYTKIPVIEATDGLAVLPGRIYLGPYMQQLTLEDGYIKLHMDLSQPSLSEISLGFFSSIAEHSKTLPVGIIFDSSHDRQSSIVDEKDRSLVSALSNPKNKDLIYAETVNVLVNAGGHVFFQDSELNQSETVVTNDNGQAVAIKAPASEISVSLQRLLQGEQIGDEFVVKLEDDPEKANVKTEVEIQPTWEPETTLFAEPTTESVTETPVDTQVLNQEQEMEVGETLFNDFEVGHAPEIDDTVANEKLKTDELSQKLRAEVSELKSKVEALQGLNTQLEEENAELIEICQTMDMEDEAANLKHFFGPEPVEAPVGTLLLLDKNLKLRSFNRAATESILAVDYMDIGQSLFKLFSAKQMDYKDVRTLEIQSQASLNMGRSNYGEPITVDISYNKKTYLISMVPMQAQAGKPIGVALSWVNL